MTLPTRKIGDADVSALGFGVMQMSMPKVVALGDEERLKILDGVFQRGCTFWDTADKYGDNEDLIGKWFAHSGKRSQVFLATKFAMTGDPARPVRCDPEWVRSAFASSCRRLGVDTIDLYYMHRPDPNTPIEETVLAMAELVKAKRVRYIGLSEVSAATLRRAHAIHPIAALQVEYSPFTLDIEQAPLELLQTARELGVTVVAYSPLGRGLLTGQYRSADDLPENDHRRLFPKFSKENFPKIVAIADGLKSIGEKHNATAGQTTLAWILAQGQDIVPIPGTSRIAALEENIQALDITLSNEEVAEVRALVEKADLVSGSARYPPGHYEQLYAETPAWHK